MIPDDQLRNCPIPALPFAVMAADAPRRRGRPPAGGREAILAATLELVREQGVGRLTTREVAERAGVSEASVYYHYTDKAGLMKAVFESGLEPLRAFGDRGVPEGDRTDVLAAFGRALESFLDQALPVLFAAQSDARLREDLAAYMADNDLGPHRGVRALGAYFAAQQAAGEARAGVDPDAAGVLLVGACFLRAAQRQIMGHAPGAEPLPSLERTIAALDALLRPGDGG
jgi:AcrR family transcriptional regulator